MTIIEREERAREGIRGRTCLVCPPGGRECWRCEQEVTEPPYLCWWCGMNTYREFKETGHAHVCSVNK